MEEEEEEEEDYDVRDPSVSSQYSYALSEFEENVLSMSDSYFLNNESEIKDF